MRNVTNRIGVLLTVIFVAFVAAHLSALDARQSAIPSRATLAGQSAVGSVVDVVCEPGEFGISATDLSGTLVALTDDHVILQQGRQKIWVARGDVLSLRVVED